MTPRAQLAIVAEFPMDTFLENLTIREDGSLLVTCVKPYELWFVASPHAEREQLRPELLHVFGEPVLGIVETEPDLFLICTSNVYTTHESYLHRLDLREWKPGTPVEPRRILQFPINTARSLNGACLIAPSVLLVADSFAGLIWRVDLAEDFSRGVARVWLRHPSMDYRPGAMKPEQPGINGLRYAPETRYLYYTATTKEQFMRVRVDPDAYDAVGEPEVVASGRMYDDFCIDENARVAYLTTHRENTIDRASLEPSENTERVVVAGDPFDEALIGPSSAAWGRRPGDYGRVAYFTSDGGTTAPPPSGVRTPKLLRVTFAPPKGGG